MSNNQEISYSWTSNYEVEEPQFTNTTFPECECNFEVADIKKTTTKHTGKPMMDIYINLSHEEYGQTRLRHFIVMTSRSKGFIDEFFASLNLLGKNKPLGDLVSDCIGLSGRCRVICEKTKSDKTKEDGTAIYYENNRIESFLKPKSKEDNQDQDNPF